MVLIKKEKHEERMHRVIVKGRKVMRPHLVSKDQKKTEFISSNNKGNDEINMLFYDNND